MPHVLKSSTEVHNIALAIGLVPAGKYLSYTRDVFWQNMKKSSMVTRDLVIRIYRKSPETVTIGEKYFIKMPKLDMHHWQTNCKRLSERLGHLLAQGYWTDCVMVVGSAKVKIPAHRVLLGCASPVLGVMLFGKMALPTSDTFTIPNIEPNVFYKVLQYIYTDSVKLDSCEIAYSLFEAAHYLNLPELEASCVAYLHKHVSTETVLPVYEFCEMYNQRALKEKCLEIMNVYTCDVLNGAGIVAARADTLAQLFAQEDLRCHSELELFQAAERWVRGQCSRRASQDTSCVSTATSSDDKKATSDDKKASTDKDKATSAKEKPSGDSEQSSSFSSRGNKEKDTEDTKVTTKEPSVKESDVGKSVASIDAQLMIREALKHIRFLTIDPNEFAKYDLSSLLTTKEIMAISLNLMSKDSCIPMPKGFSKSREPRCVRKTFWAHFNIDEFDVRTDSAHSDQMYFHDELLWRLYLKRQRRAEGGEGGSLQLSMLCDTYDEDIMLLCDRHGFTCDARVKLTLVSRNAECEIIRVKDHVFARKIRLEEDRNRVDIGPEIVWGDVLDSEKGYIYNIEGKNYITFKIEISYVHLDIYDIGIFLPSSLT